MQQERSKEWESRMVEFAKALALNACVKDIRTGLMKEALLELKSSNRIGMPHGNAGKVQATLFREGIAMQLALETARLSELAIEDPQCYKDFHETFTKAMSRGTMSQVLCMAMLGEGNRAPAQLIDLPRNYYFKWYTALNRAAMYTLGLTAVREKDLILEGWVKNAQTYALKKSRYLGLS